MTSCRSSATHRFLDQYYQCGSFFPLVVTPADNDYHNLLASDSDVFYGPEAGRSAPTSNNINETPSIVLQPLGPLPAPP
jgi:hypothetical protein